MSGIYTVQGYEKDKPLYKIEFTDSKAAALRGAKELLKLNPKIDRAVIRKKRQKSVEEIRRVE